jgi:hypothetical protein
MKDEVGRMNMGRWEDRKACPIEHLKIQQGGRIGRLALEGGKIDVGADSISALFDVGAQYFVSTMMKIRSKK